MNDPTTISFHPTRLDTESIRGLLGFMTRYYERADKLCSWLSRWLLDELERREAEKIGDYREPALLKFDIDQWSNSDLAEALPVVNAIAVSIRDEKAGKLADELLLHLIAVASAELREAENLCRQVDRVLDKFGIPNRYPDAS